MQREGINAWSIVAFLEALREEIAGPVVLLWDGLPAHKSRIVKDHVDRHKEWLSVERFPSYAPELNPVEYLFSVLKGKDVANFCADTLDEIADKLEAAADRIGDHESIIHGFLRASKLFDRQELVA